MVSLLQVPFYVAAQLTGSISASYTLRELFQPSKEIGGTTPAGSHVQALIVEMVTTFTMVFISMAVATDTNAVRITVNFLQLSITLSKHDTCR